MPKTVQAPDFEQFSFLLQSLRAVTEDETRALFAHYELLLRWNRVLNLTRIEDLQEAVERHYGESLLLADLLPAGRISVNDIGSGAGFPGIPIAIRRPECLVTLVESHQRKAVFLSEASRHLPNVRVMAVRAEALADEADWTVARAVRWQDVLPVAGAGVALLLGTEDAAAASRNTEFKWDGTIPLPGSKQRVVLMGRRHVPRGT